MPILFINLKTSFGCTLVLEIPEDGEGIMKSDEETDNEVKVCELCQGRQAAIKELEQRHEIAMKIERKSTETELAFLNDNHRSVVDELKKERNELKKQVEFLKGVVKQTRKQMEVAAVKDIPEQMVAHASTKKLPKQMSTQSISGSAVCTSVARIVGEYFRPYQCQA